MTDQQDETEIGYGKPPASTRFRKGRSGNPTGRPRGRYKQPPYEAVLGQLVTIREEGIERQVTAAEAFLLHVTKRGLEGDSAAARTTMTAIEMARANRQDKEEIEHFVLTQRYLRPGGVNEALEPLRMARKHDRYRDTARMVIEPWLVEVALARLGDRRLSLDEQKTILHATRTPAKVRWPDWWKVKP